MATPVLEPEARPEAESRVDPIGPAAPSNSRTAARRAAALRKAPTLTINYDFLRHDIRTLAILAPTMVALLVVAFIFLH